MITPWKKLKEKKAGTKYRKVVIKTFKMPDDRIVNFDIKLEGPAVCILALTKDKKVILTKQYRPGPEKILLEMPGGFIDEGEKPIKAAKREMLEETGYTGNFKFAGTCLECAYSTMLRYNFVATDCVKTQEQNLEPNEFIEITQMDLKDFRKLLQSGELSDVDTGYMCLDFLNLL